MEQTWRWYGPNDPVKLSDARQAGATGIVTALHHIKNGQVWEVDEIMKRKNEVEAAGLTFSVVESIPVHEDIKTGTGDLKTLFANYSNTLRHLAAEGITTVVYNFMPVLDWVRTDMRHVLPDGSECLRYDPVQFAAFELHALRRPGAEADFSQAQVSAAGVWWDSLDDAARDSFIQNITDVFPGCKLGLTLDDVRAMLARYAKIGPAELKANLARFLDAVLPVAESLGVKLAIHPDDPPFPVLGLPRIVGTAAQVDAILALANSDSHGLCFCTGSFSARLDNDLPDMARRFAPRIHAAHLRSTQHETSGAFFEADHLGGGVDMPAILRILLDEQDCRQAAGDHGWRMPFRPDHGHTMMDDLLKPAGITPGYSCIGRMRGLSELRGLMLGLRHAEGRERPLSARP